MFKGNLNFDPSGIFRYRIQSLSDFISSYTWLLMCKMRHVDLFPGWRPRATKYFPVRFVRCQLNSDQYIFPSSICIGLVRLKFSKGLICQLVELDPALVKKIFWSICWNTLLKPFIRKYVTDLLIVILYKLAKLRIAKKVCVLSIVLAK